MTQPSVNEHADADLAVSREIDERGRERFKVSRDGYVLSMDRFDAARVAARLRALLDLTKSDDISP
jgi:hypothetical protein